MRPLPALYCLLALLALPLLPWSEAATDPSHRETEEATGGWARLSPGRWLAGALSAQALAADPLTDLLGAGQSADEASGESADAPGSGSIDTESPAGEDAGIRTRLLGIYGALEALDRLEVAVDSGIVTLGGTADSAAAAERAIAIAEQVDGVIEVVDESTVDTDVGRRLRATLERLSDTAFAGLAALPVLLLALAVIALFWWLGRLAGARRSLFRSLAPNGFIAELLGGIVRIVVVLLGVFLALSLLDATSIIGTVLGAAGIVGLAVGFAVRDTVENYIASILLSLRTPFLARDYVHIGEHEGHVARLTSRATVLVSLDGNHIRIPNATVYKATIVNYTRDPARRFSFTVGVDTDLDLEEAQQVALDTVHQVSGVLDEPPASVIVAELGDSNVSLEVLAWVDQRESDFRKVRGAAIRHVKQAFDEAGIVMPEPIYRINMGSAALQAVVSSAEANAVDGPADASGTSGASGDPAAGGTRSDTTVSGEGSRAREAASGERPGGDAALERDGSAPTSRGGRRPAASGVDASDTSPDRSIAVTLEREIDDPDSENLLDGSRPRE